MIGAIKVENVSKAYRLGQIGTGTISRDLERWWALKRGKEDPFLKIGETNDRTSKGSSNVVWSLKDINFEIEQGDAVGIIGRNGAGKSTLLKILSRVTAPTTGQIKVKGRIASLLEVGTGFHPELTGKENIFLNGAILGMKRREILKKFDEIVDFAGIERYVDTPVKRYSSGMYVRLAFAVAAHLESEILIVDEVLAVGDAEFQKKCLGKMGDISRGEKRTVLFVSHNMNSVKRLCTKALVLNNGEVSFTGSSENAITFFNSKILLESTKSHYKCSYPIKENFINEVYFSTNDTKYLDRICLEDGKVFLNFNVCISDDFHVNLGFTLFNSEGFPLLSSSVTDSNIFLIEGKNTFKIEIPVKLLKGDTYVVQAALWNKAGVIEQNDSYVQILVEPRTNMELMGGGIKGLIINPFDWSIN